MLMLLVLVVAAVVVVVGRFRGVCLLAFPMVKLNRIEQNRTGLVVVNYVR
jgi:hypothetical protein